jgi:3-oxoadipate enol-lactonase
MPTATINGITVYYELAGPEAAPPVLWIGGSGEDLRRRPNVLDGPITQRFRVLAYDQRGLGQSEIPPGPYTMGHYAADAVALLDHVGWERAAVAGVSFGGMVAQELAVTWPERVNRLLLCCTSPGGPSTSSYPLERLAELTAEERAEQSLSLLDTRGPSAPGLAALFARLQQAQAIGADEPGRADGARYQLEARAGHDVLDRLHRIVMPTLICAGRYDGIAPPANQEVMHGAIPGSRLEWFEGGHAFQFQDDRATPTMIAFLAGELS